MSHRISLKEANKNTKESWKLGNYRNKASLTNQIEQRRKDYIESKRKGLG